MGNSRRRERGVPAPAAGAEEPFLERWSRRKRGLEAEDGAKEVPGEAPPEGGSEPAPVLRDEDMPDLSAIDEGADVGPFFSPGVSEELRQAALKRLFRSTVFNVRDGLDDYDDDFRSFQSLGDVVTTEMRRQQEREEIRRKERLARRADPEPAAAAAGAGEAVPGEQSGDGGEEEPAGEHHGQA